MTNRFISTIGAHAPSGQWDFEDHGPDASESICVLPNGTVLPAVTYNTGQMFFISNSGILAISISGVWRTSVGV